MLTSSRARTRRASICRASVRHASTPPARKLLWLARNAKLEDGVCMPCPMRHVGSLHNVELRLGGKPL